ncbi:Phosphate starvation-inducible protein psiF precursor [Pseudomonas savastanoi]|nr:Phosphate starvation-inducible protein psiF precursor [Pseudomonas savastanoi]
MTQTKGSPRNPGRFTTASTQALKGDARKSFMSDCLKKK